MYFNIYDVIILNPKRPYGNSSVMLGVFTEYYSVVGKYPFDINPDEDIVDQISTWCDGNGYEFLFDIHSRTMDIFDLALSELELNCFEWEPDSNNMRWGRQEFHPTKNGLSLYQKHLREKKLERILIYRNKK